MKTCTKYIITVVLAFLLPFGMTEGKGFSSSRSGGSSSSSRSSFSSGSRSTPSVSKPSFSSGSSTKPSTSVSKPSTGFSNSNSKTSTSSSAPRQKSSFDYAQQRQSLTPPKPKEQYVSDFKKNNAAKYPTTFTTPPASRPNYIPPTTTYGGQQRPIEYNTQTQSYGFFDGLGKFMIYDAITNMATNSFQKEHTVYVQQAAALDQKVAQAQKVEAEEGHGVGFYILIIFLTILAFVAIGAMVSINKNKL
jgi:hypothetical protein